MENFKQRGLILVVNYNQALEIEAYLHDCLSHFQKDQILVVDDGSTDNSYQVAERLGLKVLRSPHNRGIGAAIRTGLYFAREQKFDWILISSSNGKMIPSEFPIVYGPVDRGQVEFTQGSRFLLENRSQGLPLFRRFAIPIFTFLVRILLWQKLSDATCGLRCYKTSLLNHPSLYLDQAWLERYEMEYYLLYKFLKVMRVKWVEVPVTIRYQHLQKDRQSKIVPFRGWWSMIRPFVILTLKLRS